MKHGFSLLLCCLVLNFPAIALAQAKPTATRPLVPSAFVLVGGAYTGLGLQATNVWDGGRNIFVAAGLDVGFYSIGHYEVGAEVRGSFPLISGQVVGDRSLLGGARVSYESNLQLRPYIDVLAGRGQMAYQAGGFVSGDKLYKETSGGVFGGGGGLEWDVLQKISLKIDAQTQRWGTAVVDRGFVKSLQGSIGLTYRFGAGNAPR